MRAERDEAQHEHAAMRDAWFAHQAHVATLNTRLAEVPEQRRMNTLQLETLRNQLDQSREQAKIDAATITAVTKERNDALHSVAELLTAQDALQGRIQDQECSHQEIVLQRDRATEAVSSELAEIRNVLNAKSRSLDQWHSRSERWEQEHSTLTDQLSMMETKAASDQQSIEEIENANNSLRATNAALTGQLDTTISMFNKAEEQQQTLLKALSVEFTAVVRDASSSLRKSPKTQ